MSLRPVKLPERCHAVPAPCHAVTMPPQSRWARATPPGPLPRRLTLARRRSGSPPASASRCAVRRSTPPSPRLPSDVRHARGVPPGIDCDRSRRLGARDRRPGPPHCPARACQKTPKCSAQLWTLRWSLRCVPRGSRCLLGRSIHLCGRLTVSVCSCCFSMCSLTFRRWTLRRQRDRQRERQPKAVRCRSSRSVSYSAMLER